METPETFIIDLTSKLSDKDTVTHKAAIISATLVQRLFPGGAVVRVPEFKNPEHMAAYIREHATLEERTSLWGDDPKIEEHITLSWTHMYFASWYDCGCPTAATDLSGSASPI